MLRTVTREEELPIYWAGLTQMAVAQHTLQPQYILLLLLISVWDVIILEGGASLSVHPMLPRTVDLWSVEASAWLI